MPGQFAWTLDAPTGTFKNNALSNKLYEASIADAKTAQFVTNVDGYGRKRGESVTLSRVSNLSVPTSAQLSETIPIPEDTLAISSKAITVSEFGRAVTYTGLSNDLANIEIPETVERALTRQMTTSLDRAAMDAFKAAKVKAIPDASASLVFDTDGTPSTTAAVNLEYYHVEQIRDYLVSTLLAPPFVGDEYFCLASTKALRGLKQDPKWEEWSKYTMPEAKATGEVGKIEGIRFVEVADTGALSASKGTGGVLGEAVFFGADAVAQAMVVVPHLRHAIPSDFGRSNAVAWYGILKWDIIWDTANSGEARVVHLTSA